jgi:hypothetical protein
VSPAMGLMAIPQLPMGLAHAPGPEIIIRELALGPSALPSRLPRQIFGRMPARIEPMIAERASTAPGVCDADGFQVKFGASFPKYEASGARQNSPGV